MSMDQRTREALEASIAHWRDNVAAKKPKEASTDGDDCPLCDEFFPDEVSEGQACIGCPVFNATGETHCQTTPYYAADMAHAEWAEGCISREDWRKAAQAELDFLISLRPSDEGAA